MIVGWSTTGWYAPETGEGRFATLEALWRAAQAGGVAIDSSAVVLDASVTDPRAAGELSRFAQAHGVAPPLRSGLRAPTGGVTVQQNAVLSLTARPAPPTTTAMRPNGAEFPGADWRVDDPRAHGLDPAGLARLGEYARSIDSESLLIVRDGRIVYEWYGEGVNAGTPLETQSAAKTYTAALIAAAIRRGEIESIDQPVSDFIREWSGRDDPRRTIRIRDILSGTSGLDTHDYPERVSPFRRLLNMIHDYGWSALPFSRRARDQSRFAIGAELTRRPGTTWQYNNRAVQVLEEVLERAGGKRVDQLARERLWEPIGMGGRTDWRRDASGNVTTYSSVTATTRDQARFGWLLLNGGRWNGRQILDPELVRGMGHSSQDVNPAYGFLTWVNTDAPAWRSFDNRRYQGRPIPDMPPDYFSAQSFGNSFIGVAPSTGTVIVHVRRAPNERLTSDWPWKVVPELFNDSEQRHHREIARLLHAAEQPAEHD